MERSSLAALLVAPLAAVLVFASTPDEPEPSDRRPASEVPIEHASLACPVMPPGSEFGSATVISPTLDGADEPVSDLPERPVEIGSGRAKAGALDGRGRAWTGARRNAVHGIRVEAQGALAAGLTGAAAAVYDGGERRGLFAAACSEPAARWWFPSASSSAGQTGVLQLANVDTGVAVVDLAFFGPDGPVEPAGESRVSVGPRRMTTVPLDEVIPGVGAVSVGVSASQGRVVASMLETSTDALDPAGIDVIPPAADPARRVVLTGLPGDSAQHTLSVVNPGQLSAVVDIEILGQRGAFTPTDKDSLQVPGGGAVNIRLGDVLQDRMSGVRLTSDLPVTAAVRTAAGTPLRDTAFAVAGEPLTTGAAVPLLSNATGTLVVSGTERALVRVKVARVNAKGRVVGRAKIDVRGGQTETWRVKTGRGTAYLRITADRPDRLVAAMHWTRPDGGGRMASTVPLHPLRLTVDRPPITYDPVEP
ncbi:MAG: hypothetical protein GEU93_05670 [Propionibacteriales bacterium]|nr:hypothetical protein [Propionibacteriales bacterium]